MRRQIDEAFVLRTHSLGEADLIAEMIAEQHGKVRCVARSARRSRKRFGGLLEPMTRVRATWVEIEGRDLHRLESLEALRSFAEMQSDPLNQAACAVLAELSGAFGHEGQAELHGFRLLGAVLEALEDGRSPRGLLRYFEFWMLRIHGLLPDLEHCSRCAGSLTRGTVRVYPGEGVRCSRCPAESNGREARLAGDDRRFLDCARRLPPGELPDDVVSRPGPALESLLRGTLEAFAERSFRTYRHFKSAERQLADGSEP